MSEIRYCVHCESPLDDEMDDLDENGHAFCDCDGATIEKLEKEFDELRAEVGLFIIYIKQGNNEKALLQMLVVETIIEKEKGE